MAIYLDKLNILLQAIHDKDTADITAKKVYLPFIGRNYTEAGLQTWLGGRTVLLQYAKDHPTMNVQIAIGPLYNSLNTEDKLIADKILAEEEYLLVPSGQDGYEKLVKIILYKFITTP